MQYLMSSPLCVTFSWAGLFLGSTISYRQDPRRDPLKAVTSVVYFHSPKQSRWTLYTWCITAFLMESKGDLHHLERGWVFSRTERQTEACSS